MALRFKKNESEGAVRLGYTDGENLHRAGLVTDNPGKVFAVIGPFDGHMDKPELQKALDMLLRGFNIEVS